MQQIHRLNSGILALILAIATPMATYAAGQKRGPPPPLPWWQQPPPDPERPRDSAKKNPKPKARKQGQAVYRPSSQDPGYRHDSHQVLWQQHRAHAWKTEHRDWRERGGYRGHRIPEQQYHARFGPTHLFRLRFYPVRIVSGYIHFQYGGFGFSVVDPVPEYWSDTWYNDDDMYILDADEGYYMQNRRYPQDRIAISVSIR